MEIKRFLEIIRKRFLLIICITLGFTLAAGGISYFLIRPTYRADTWIIIGSPGKSSESSGQSYNDILMYQQMVKTYSRLAKSRIVAEDVKQKIGIKSINTSELQAMITVTPDNDTQFLEITVRYQNQEQAMNIANQFAKSLKEISLKVNKVDIVEIIDEAQLPVKPDSPKPVQNSIMASFLAVILSTGLSILLEYFDNTIKTKEDVENLLEIPVIGTISLINVKEVDVII